MVLGETTFNDVLIAYVPVVSVLVAGVVAIYTKKHDKAIKQQRKELDRVKSKVNGDGFDEGNDYAV